MNEFNRGKFTEFVKERFYSSLCRGLHDEQVYFYYAIQQLQLVDLLNNFKKKILESKNQILISYLLISKTITKEDYQRFLNPHLLDELFEVQIKHPVLTKDQILFALYNYRTLDLSSQEGKQRLIDGFVNSIYLYDDRFVITFNYKGRSKTVSFEQLNSSSLTSKGSPKEKAHHVRCAFSLPFLS